jgi:hypothetical protein
MREEKNQIKFKWKKKIPLIIAKNICGLRVDPRGTPAMPPSTIRRYGFVR